MTRLHSLICVRVCVRVQQQQQARSPLAAAAVHVCAVGCRVQAPPLSAQAPTAHHGRVPHAGRGGDAQGARGAASVLPESRLRRLEDRQSLTEPASVRHHTSSRHVTELFKSHANHRHQVIVYYVLGRGAVDYWLFWCWLFCCIYYRTLTNDACCVVVRDIPHYLHPTTGSPRGSALTTPVTSAVT